MSNRTEQGFLQEAYQRQMNYFEDKHSEWMANTNEEELDFYTSAFQQAKNAITVDLPMFLSADGILNIYVPIPSLAGSAFVYEVLQF